MKLRGIAAAVALVVLGCTERKSAPVSSPVCAAIASGRDVNQELATIFGKQAMEGVAEARARYCTDAGARGRHDACSPDDSFVMSLSTTADCLKQGERVWQVLDDGTLKPVDRLPDTKGRRYKVYAFENRGRAVNTRDEHVSEGELVVDHEGSFDLRWRDDGVSLTVTSDTFD